MGSSLTSPAGSLSIGRAFSGGRKTKKTLRVGALKVSGLEGFLDCVGPWWSVDGLESSAKDSGRYAKEQG